MKHYTFAVLAAAAIMTASAGMTLAAAPYTDLSGAAHRESIDYLYDTHCLTFVTGNTFAPQAVLTRGELAQLIYNAAASLPVTESAFSDVHAGGRAADAMAAVSSQGILAGYEDGSFHPDDPVTREEFAGVIYRYLQYMHMAEKDGETSPCADEAQIAPDAAAAVDVLRSKQLMVTKDNLFRPKEGITRADAVETVYHLLHSDDQYVSHVQIETEVLRSLTAEYGSPAVYFREGTMYWDGDTLVLGMTRSPGRFFTARLKRDVSRPDAVVIRRVRLSRNAYDQMLNRAVSLLVEKEGVQNYIGAMPDYAREQVIIMVRRPVQEETLKELADRIGEGVLRIESEPGAGQDKAVQEVQASAAGKRAKNSVRENKPTEYSSLITNATARTIDSIQQDAMNK